MTKLVSPQTFDREFNVKAYGATGDGSTDDRAAMQLALDALNANGGGTLIIPPGTYILAQALNIGPAGNIRVVANGATLRRSASAPSDMFALIQNIVPEGQAGETSYSGYSGSKNIHISGGIWDVNGRAGGPTFKSNGLIFAHSTNITIKDLTVLDVLGYHAIEINSTDGAVVENCTFSGFNDDNDTRQASAAVQFDFPSAPTMAALLYDNTFCKNVSMIGCTTKESADLGSYGRMVESHSTVDGFAHENIRIVDNYARGLIDYSILAQGWQNCVISGNTFESCNGGIKLEIPDGILIGDKSPIQNIVVADNVLDDMGVANGNVSGTLFVGGVYVLGLSSTVNGRNISISNNVIRKWLNSHAIVVDRGTQIKITGNSISEGSASSALGRAMYVLDSTYVIVSNNSVNSIKEGGLRVTTSSNCQVENNVMFDIGTHGIQLIGAGTDVQISDNYIKGAGRATNVTYSGVTIGASYVGFSVTGNKIRKFGSGNEVLHGISITSTCSGGLVRYNDLFDTTIDDDSVTPVTTVTSPTLLLYRTTTQAIANNTDTVVAWSSAQKNTGPTTWWSSGAVNNIVLPWAGLYHVTCFVGWASNATGVRAVHLNRTVTIATSNFKMGVSTTGSGAAEGGRVVNFSGMLHEATAGTVYILAAYQNSGGNLNIDNMQSGQQAEAWISLTYLGN